MENMISAMKEINSFEELKANIAEKDRTYLLLYKSGSENSECARHQLTEGSNGIENLNIFFADVNKVRDIHGQFQITSVPALLDFVKGQLKNVVKGCNGAGYYKALFEDAIYFASAEQEGKPAKSVTVYSTPTCPWCTTLKNYLKKHHIRFTDIDVSRDKNSADELVRRSGQMGVPQTDIAGEMIVGFNKARINQLLDIKG